MPVRAYAELVAALQRAILSHIVGARDRSRQLSRAALVAMMESAHFRKLHHRSEFATLKDFIEL